MRDDRTEAGSEQDALAVLPGKTVRFGALVKNAGQPEVYLPLFDPKQDRAFMQAVKQQRVLSIRQEPASRRTDFGIVGFDERKHTTYLVFPKPLKQFANARVIGIKYDVIGESALSSGNAPPASRTMKPKRSKAAPAPKPAAKERSVRVVTPVKPTRAFKPEPPPKPKPQPTPFRVHVRITIVAEKHLTVSAMTKAEAKMKAKQAVSAGDVRILSIDAI
jgi:hypothetical protein